MFVFGYNEMDECVYFDYENMIFCNNINEILSFFQYDEIMQNEIKKTWDKFNFFNKENKPYIIYIFGNGDGYTMGMCSREWDVILYDWETKPKWEKISNFDEWVNENFEIPENVRLIEILLNNCDLFGV